MSNYLNDIQPCLAALQSGGVILFPTDTIWGLGCDATNEQAVDKILHIKQRQAAQGVIILLADIDQVHKYAAVPNADVLALIATQQKPTTVIYEGGKKVAANVLPQDKTLAIRIVNDAFCKELIYRFGGPLVSTSANIHGRPAPQNFSEIEKEVIRQADYTVQYRQADIRLSRPSAILKIKPDGFETIRL